MNKFLKLAILPVAFLVAGATSSCSPSPREIALITDIGDIDDGSFNQESWEAIKGYAIDNHKSYDFYRPFNDSEFARICAVKQAVAKGAQVIVMPGFKFASTCYQMMTKFPKVHFLLIDTPVHKGDYAPVDPTPNTCCVGFKCEYSGFIAGYTIAQDLMKRDLEDEKKVRKQYGYGYMGGMSQSGVYEFGYGYIQGICQGTNDFCDEHNITGANKPKILIQYDYAGVFAQDDKAAIKVKSWYTAEGDDNVKVVFPCGGKLYQSVTEGAQYYNKHYVRNYEAWFKGKLDHAPRDGARWVGVDSDQYRGLKYDHELQSIYTSALKGLNPAIVQALDLHYAGEGEWEEHIGGPRTISEGKIGAGSQWLLGLDCVFGDYPDGQVPPKGDFVGIPDVYDEKTKIMRGFDKYTFDDFKKLYEKLINPKTSGLEVCADSGALANEKGTPIKGGWCDKLSDFSKIKPGYPYKMTDWEKDIKDEEGKVIDVKKYHSEYLKYDKDLIDIRSPMG